MTVLTGGHVDTRNNHGTGCSLSAAIAACLARGADVPTAVVGGQGIRATPPCAAGRGGASGRATGPSTIWDGPTSHLRASSPRSDRGTGVRPMAVEAVVGPGQGPLGGAGSARLRGGGPEPPRRPTRPEPHWAPLSVDMKVAGPFGPATSPPTHRIVPPVLVQAPLRDEPPPLVRALAL